MTKVGTKNNKRRKVITPVLLALLIMMYMATPSYAYTFDPNNPKYNDPLTVSVYISSSVPISDDVVSVYDNWDYMSEIQTYRSYDLDYAEAYFTYSSVDSGPYASCGSSGLDWKQITIRPKWKTLSTTLRQETIAHEMGHAWGLGHVVDNAIMREYGFMNNAYPWFDDENGIRELY
jgi:hypothetical protein